MVADSKSKSDISFAGTFASSAFSACFAEVIDLLKWSLVSNTVLTDSLLRRKQSIENPKATLMISEKHGREDRRMKLNIVIEKSKCKVVFAIVDEESFRRKLWFMMHRQIVQ
ncbi:hypothetical protein K1719_012914 [Acacia pycnantha]|nr:hypothetical protein K1719_012914 [Acacia pycnantha]